MNFTSNIKDMAIEIVQKNHVILDASHVKLHLITN